MAIHINPTNINPNVGDVYQAVYRGEMAKLEPWMKMRNDAIKQAGNVAKIAFMGDWGGADDIDVGDSTQYYAVNNGELDETDMDLMNKGIDPRLFNDMNRYNTATTNYRSMFDMDGDLWRD